MQIERLNTHEFKLILDDEQLQKLIDRQLRFGDGLINTFDDVIEWGFEELLKRLAES